MCGVKAFNQALLEGVNQFPPYSHQLLLKVKLLGGDAAAFFWKRAHFHTCHSASGAGGGVYFGGGFLQIGSREKTAMRRCRDLGHECLCCVTPHDRH
jgi:hypothetical protein